MHGTFLHRLIASGWPRDIAAFLAAAAFIYGSNRFAEIAALIVAARP